MPKKSLPKKRKTTGQEEIIKLLRKKQWNHVWEKVKYVGYGQEPDINKRYLLFKKACQDFNAKKYDNFILFYKNYIKYYGFDKNLTFTMTSNENFIHELINESISPTDDAHPMVQQLKQINP